MNARFAPILLASLLGTTAVAPAALAQEAGQPAGSEQGCEGLPQLIEENTGQLTDEWVAEANTVVQSGDDANCTTYHQQATEALAATGGEGAAAGAADAEADADAGASIVVTQPDPQVSVQQPAPEVSVT